MCSDPKSMRDVVMALIAERASALAELEEHRIAVREILLIVVDLDRVARQLADDVARVRTGTALKAPPIVVAMHERVTAISVTIAQVLAAFRELNHGVSGWWGQSPDVVPPLNGAPSN